MKGGYNLGTLITVIKTDIRELVNTQLELLKLEAFEKTSIVGSFLIYGLIIMNLVFFALLFAFIALGFLIGNWIDSTAGGFAIVTLIYLLILIILIACRKSILAGFKNLFLKELDPDLEDEVKYESKRTHQAHAKRRPAKQHKQYRPSAKRDEEQEYIIKEDIYELD
jgi:uncharacterized membrane protein YqjE